MLLERYLDGVAWALGAGTVGLIFATIAAIVLLFAWWRIKRMPKRVVKNAIDSGTTVYNAGKDHLAAAGAAAKPHADRIAATAGRFASDGGTRLRNLLKRK